MKIAIISVSLSLILQIIIPTYIKFKLNENPIIKYDLSKILGVICYPLFSLMLCILIFTTKQTFITMDDVYTSTYIAVIIQSATLISYKKQFQINSAITTYLSILIFFSMFIYSLRRLVTDKYITHLYIIYFLVIFLMGVLLMLKLLAFAKHNNLTKENSCDK